MHTVKLPSAPTEFSSFELYGFYWYKILCFSWSPGSKDTEPRDVNVAKSRKQEGKLQTNEVGEFSCRKRDNGAANNSCDHQARAFAGQRSEILNPEGEDGRKHDGVTESDR